MSEYFTPAPWSIKVQPDGHWILYYRPSGCNPPGYVIASSILSVEVTPITGVQRRANGHLFLVAPRLFMLAHQIARGTATLGVNESFQAWVMEQAETIVTELERSEVSST